MNRMMDVANLTHDGLDTAKAFILLENWKEFYTFNKKDDNKFWWEASRGVKSGYLFETNEDSIASAFLHFCNTHHVKIMHDE